MVRCNLSMLMGRHKMKIIDVARATDLHRNTITLLYNEEAARVELEVVNKLCKLFSCSVGELFEYLPDDDQVGVTES
jgi:putative transcriptional regulator